VLIDEQGHCLLTDFGLSKEGMFEKKLTSTILGGGASYQIPEILNEASYDKSVDLYLLGLLAYELVEGKHCFPMEKDPDIQKDKIKSSDY